MDRSDAILDELKKIAKILSLAHAATVEKEIEKLASSEARKRIWVLIDGTRMPKDIAKEVSVTEQAVYYFLNALAAAGLAENPRGKPPRRVLEYVPPSWIEIAQQSNKVEREQDGKTVTSEQTEGNGE